MTVVCGERPAPPACGLTWSAAPGRFRPEVPLGVLRPPRAGDKGAHRPPGIAFIGRDAAERTGSEIAGGAQKSRHVLNFRKARPCAPLPDFDLFEGSMARPETGRGDASSRPEREILMPCQKPSQAAFFLGWINPRSISNSAIWMALSAAPLRKLSDTIHIESPLSMVESSRMREMKVASSPADSSGVM